MTSEDPESRPETGTYHPSKPWRKTHYRACDCSDRGPTSIPIILAFMAIVREAGLLLSLPFVQRAQSHSLLPSPDPPMIFSARQTTKSNTMFVNQDSVKPQYGTRSHIRVSGGWCIGIGHPTTTLWL